MATRTLPQADPFVADAEPTPVDMDMAEHIRTYDGFLKLSKWFLAHIAVMLVSLYSFVIAHNGGMGFLFLFIAIGVLVYGIVRRPTVQKDLAAASAPRGPAGAH